MKKIFCYMVLVLSPLVYSAPLSAAEPLVITETRVYSPMGRHFDLLKDPDGNLTLEEILADPGNMNFIPGKGDVFSMGFTTDIYWIRSVVENATDQEKNVVIEMPIAWFDNLKLYVPDQNGNPELQVAGDRIKYSQKTWPHRNHIFRLHFAPGEKKTLYIRAEAEDAMVLPFYLWLEDGFQTHDNTMSLVFGILYGIMIALAVYNLFVYYALREISYLYYVLYIFGWVIFLFATNGSAMEYFWPENPYWGNRAPLFGAVLANLFAGFFIREFLQIKRVLPAFDRWIMAGIWFCGIMLLVSVAWPFYRYADLTGTPVLTMVYGPFLFYTAIRVYKKGIRHARFFILAWFFPMAGMMVFGMGCFNIVPFNFITTHSIDFGAALEAILLSLALADRIDVLRKKKDSAEKEAAVHLEEATTLNKELDIARKIQDSLFPVSLPVNDQMVCAAYYRTANKVSGDFYDIHYAHGSWYFLMADVTGHGAGSAIVASMVKSSVQSALLTLSDPDKILIQASHIITGEGQALPFTAALLQLDFKSGIFRFVRAGHPPMFYVKRLKNEVRLVHSKGRMIGVVPELNLEVHQGTIEKGDRFFLYTDGLPEAINENKETFEDKVMPGVINETINLPAQKMIDKIKASFQEFIGNKVPDDDVTMLVVDIDQ